MLIGEAVKEEIRRLQEEGETDTEISRILGVPRSTVRYQRPEVRKRQKKYLQRPGVRARIKEIRLRRNPDFYELTDVIEEIECSGGPRDIDALTRNSYVFLLSCLGSSPRPLRHKRIVRELCTKLPVKDAGPKLRRLRQAGLVSYDNKDYSLTPRGKEVSEYFRPKGSSVL